MVRPDPRECKVTQVHQEVQEPQELLEQLETLDQQVRICGIQLFLNEMSSNGKSLHRTMWSVLSITMMLVLHAVSNQLSVDSYIIQFKDIV
jgi:hypothetical protein